MKKLFICLASFFLMVANINAQNSENHEHAVSLTIAFDKTATRTVNGDQVGEWSDLIPNGGFIYFDFPNNSIAIASKSNEKYEIMGGEELKNTPVGGYTFKFTIKTESGSEILAKIIKPTVSKNKIIFVVFYPSEHFYYDGIVWNAQ